MQQAVAVAGRGLQRVSEGMAKVQQGAVALLGFVALDDIGLHAHRMAHRRLTCAPVASRQRRTVRFEPCEIVRVAQQPVFDDLAIAGQKIARRHCVEHLDIGQHQTGLMERADQVLALRAVDPGLAAHRTVDLCQKRGRDLHETHAPAQDRGGEPDQITDHAATKGNHNIAALDLLRQQPFNRGL